MALLKLKAKKPKIKECFSIINTTYFKNRPIKYIVIHYSASPSSKGGRAENTANYFARPLSKASADFIVDEKEIVQYNGDIRNRYCWAVGGGKQNTKGGKYYDIATNKNCIHIEMCSDNEMGVVTWANDKAWFIRPKVFKKTVNLVKWLMQEYNIPAYMIIRHYDVNGKLCPGGYGWNAESGSESEWERFKRKIAK